MNEQRDKAAIREELRRQRRALAPAWIAERSRQAQEQVMGLPEFASAKAVGCYLAMPDEVQTDAILARCRREGRTVCVPARGPDGAYAFSRLEPDGVIERGVFGVPEPAVKDWRPAGDLNLIVVPGLAFDPRGGRVGHGAGHYDRLLAGCRAFRAGLAFEFQVLERVPAAEHDEGMDAVVTELRIVRCAERVP